MSPTIIEWLIALLFLAMLVLLIAARVRVARRRCPELRNAHWLTGTVAPTIGGDACADVAAGCDGGGTT